MRVFWISCKSLTFMQVQGTFLDLFPALQIREHSLGLRLVSHLVAMLSKSRGLCLGGTLNPRLCLVSAAAAPSGLDFRHGRGRKRLRAPAPAALVGLPAPSSVSSPSFDGTPCKAARPAFLALPSLPPELLAIGLVYFVQGIMELATLAQTYHLKDELHANPAQVALFLSAAGIPWTIKPLIGFISDTVPLWGYRRRSYLLLASAAGTASYMWMARGPASAVGFLGAMLLSSSASAVSDVVVDSMVVERARGESQETAGSLQSLCWASYAVAQVVTASLSGSMVQDYGPRKVFELTALFPLLVGGASVLLQEQPVTSTESSTACAASSSGSAATAASTSSSAVTAVSSASSSTLAASSYGSAPSQHISEGASSSYGNAMGVAVGGALSGHAAQPAAHMPSGSLAHDLPVPAAPFSVATAPPPPPTALPTTPGGVHAGLVWAALRRPDVSAPLSFLLLLSATPSADSALFFYQTEELGFSAAFLGQIQLAAACASFVGVILYNSCLKRVPLRPLMLWGTLLAAGLQCSQLVLVSGVHRTWGLDDHMFVLGGSVVLDVVQNVLSMPFMVLAARLCPAGIEATMFATIMSLTNLADAVRMGGGAALMSALHVSPEDWTNLPTLLGVCNASLLLPLVLLGTIPDTVDGEAGAAAEGEVVVGGAAGMPAADTSFAAVVEGMREVADAQGGAGVGGVAVGAGVGAVGVAVASNIVPGPQLSRVGGGVGAVEGGGAPRGCSEAPWMVDSVSLLTQPGSHAVHHHYHTPHLQRLATPAASEDTALYYQPQAGARDNLHYFALAGARDTLYQRPHMQPYAVVANAAHHQHYQAPQLLQPYPSAPSVYQSGTGSSGSSSSNNSGSSSSGITTTDITSQYSTSGADRQAAVPARARHANVPGRNGGTSRTGRTSGTGSGTGGGTGSRTGRARGAGGDAVAQYRKQRQQRAARRQAVRRGALWQSYAEGGLYDNTGCVVEEECECVLESV